MLVVLALAAVCLSPPVNGEIVAPYSPTGQYSGHWGVDFSVPPRTPVSAPVAGRVSFAGSVAGMKSVTIQPVAGFKVSLSYLARVDVRAGDWVGRGEMLGLAGYEDGRAVVHMSTRLNNVYVDPAKQMGCRRTDITRALRLVAPPQPYPRRRANRNPRRDIRPNPYRPPSRRRGSDASSRARSCPLRPGRPAMAKR